MLEIKNLVTSYGLIKALKGISLTAKSGEITCILGPNGAGKTTLMFTVAGILKPDQGTIEHNGENITALSAPNILKTGLALVPENRLVFPTMTVRDNLDAGAFLRPSSDKKSVEEDIEKMFTQFPVLKQRSSQTAGTLSGGEQQMLAIARALMSRPKLLLMDEPSVGLAPKIVDEIFEIIQNLKDQDLSILLVEQNAAKALKIADHFYLLDQGNVAFSGSPAEVESDDILKKAYLGSDAA